MSQRCRETAWRPCALWHFLLAYQSSLPVITEQSSQWGEVFGASLPAAGRGPSCH